MISVAIIISSVAVLCVSVAVFLYLKTGKPFRNIFVLIAIRILLVLLIILAFSEPIFNFTGFSKEKPAIAVLIDNSKSMSMFGADSLLATVDSALSINEMRPAKERLNIRRFLFGDSLRPVNSNKKISFNDEKSCFPLFQKDRFLKKANNVLIFSDGNWQENPHRLNEMELKNCYYAVLPDAVRRPFLHLEPESPLNTIADSSSVVNIHISGYKTSTEPLRLTCTGSGHEVWRRDVVIPPGPFSDTLIQNMPSAKPGTFLYNIRASLPEDSISTSGSLIQRVTPGKLTAVIVSGQPSLDRRFITIEVARNAHWKLLPCNGRTPYPDIAFFLEWNNDAEKKFQSLSSKTTAIFAGCTPCKNAENINPREFRLFMAREYNDRKTNPEIFDIPVPRYVSICTNSKMRNGRTILSAFVKADDGTIYDSLPVLYEHFFLRKKALVMSAGPVWQMDFRPRSVANEKTSFILDFILKKAEETASANMNSTLFAYPEKNPVFDSDSAVFMISIPSHLQDRIIKEIKIKVSGPNAEKDTLLIKAISGKSAIRIALPPMSHGDYAFECIVNCNNEKLIFSDSISVNTNDYEMMTSGQNSMVLNQIATPVNFNETRDFLWIVENQSGQIAAPTKRFSIRFRQTVWLIFLILSLMAAEWILRKKLRLD